MNKQTLIERLLRGSLNLLINGSFRVWQRSNAFTTEATIVMAGNTTNTSPVITNLANAREIPVNALISGSGIPALAYVVSVDSDTQITINDPATATASSVSLTFTPQNLAALSGGLYTADRWRVEYDGTMGALRVSRGEFAVGQSDVPGNPKNFLRWHMVTAGSGSTKRWLTQRIEDVSVGSNGDVSFSLYAKSDAVRTLGVHLRQNFGTGGAPSSTVISASKTVSLSTGWKKYSFSFSLPGIAGKVLGTNANDFLELVLEMPLNTVCDIQIASAVSSIGGEMDFIDLKDAEIERCQRYFEKSYNLDSPPGLVSYVGSNSVLGSATTGTAVAPPSIFKVTKKANPTVVVYNPNTGVTGTGFDGTGNPTITPDSIGQNSWGANVVGVSANGRLRWHWTADSEL